MEKIKIIVDGKEMFGEAGETILTIAARNGVEIPNLCYNKNLKLYGACGVCVVEAENSPKLLRACSALAADGKIKFANVPALQFISGDYIKNYMKCGCSDRLLKALGAAVTPFGTNTEESYCCGEGALVLDKLNPSLVALMVETVKRHAVAGMKIAVTDRKSVV